MYKGLMKTTVSIGRRSTDLPNREVFTVVGIGMSDDELRRSSEACGVLSGSISVKSISDVDVSMVETDCFICIESEQHLGWLSEKMRLCGLPSSVRHDAAEARRCLRHKPQACRAFTPSGFVNCHRV